MTLNDLKLRARALLRRNRAEQELQEELAVHIERETRKSIDDGMSTAVIDNTIRDVQYALRAFAAAPLAAFTIVVTVALPLGSDTSRFGR